MMASRQTIALRAAYYRQRIAIGVVETLLIAAVIVIAVLLTHHHHHHTPIPTVTLTSFTATPFSRSSTATWNFTFHIPKPEPLVDSFTVILQYSYTNTTTGLTNMALVGDPISFHFLPTHQTIFSGSAPVEVLPDVAGYLISDQTRGSVLANIGVSGMVKEGSGVKILGWVCHGVIIRFTATVGAAQDVPIKCWFKPISLEI